MTKPESFLLFSVCHLSLKSSWSYFKLETYSDFVRNLGIIFNSSLSFKKHIKLLSKSSIPFLCNLRHFQLLFFQANFELGIYALVTSLFDSWNFFFTGVSASGLLPLKLVQNYIANHVYHCGEFTHINPTLSDLYWLLIKF